MIKKTRSVYLPFMLTFFVFIADQLTKYWIVTNVEMGTIFLSLFSDLLWIVHVRNNAVGFSLGSTLPEAVKAVLFIAVPLVLVIFVIIFMIRSRELRTSQRWFLSGLIGGGMGNLFDRMFREEWVVDFISVRVYGLFGFERWPTFNVADASVVVCAILLMISLLLEMRRERKGEKDE